MSRTKSPLHLRAATSTSLQSAPDYLNAVNDALWRCNLTPLNTMPTEDDAVAAALQRVERADIFVCVEGLPVDSLREPLNQTIHDAELTRARELALPIYTFRLANPATEPNTFDTPQELGKRLVYTLHGIDLQPRTQDAPQPAPTNGYIAHPYSMSNKFVGRKQELVYLNTWARSRDSTLVVEGIGGLGKSALTWEWMRTHARKALPKVNGIIWWSFYESDATMTNFVRSTLSYLTQQPPETYHDVPFEQQINSLLEALSKNPHLIVMDGIERIFIAYHRHDAPHLLDEKVEESTPVSGTPKAQQSQENWLRSCTDTRHGDCLRRLVNESGASRILISTRLFPSDLQDRESGKIYAGVRRHLLEGLHPDDALEVMHMSGVTGDAKAIRRFTNLFGNHSLLVQVIAGSIGHTHFGKWYDSVGKSLELEKQDEHQRRVVILNYVLKNLRPELYKLLSQTAAFRYPVSFAALSALNPLYKPKPSPPEDPQWIEEELEWEAQSIRETEDQLPSEYYLDLQARLATVRELWKQYEETDIPRLLESNRHAAAAFHVDLLELEQRGLVMWNRRRNTYDLHPVVRAYAYEQLQGDDRRDTYKRIYDHFQRLPPAPRGEVHDLGDLQHYLQIYYALVGAGQLDEASRFYASHFWHVLYRHLAAYTAIIEILTPLFTAGIDALPPDLSLYEQKNSVNALGLAFYHIGETKKARALLKWMLRLALDKKEYWGLCDVGLFNYALPLIYDRRFAETLRVSVLMAELAAAVNYSNGLVLAARRALGIYVNTGQWLKAKDAYENFYTGTPELWLQSEAEHERARMLFFQGEDPTEALDKSWEIALRANYMIVRNSILHLRAEYALQQGEVAKAVDYFLDAIELARRSGTTYRSELGGLARAFVAQGRLDAARQQVEMGVTDVDAAEVYLALGDKKLAEERALTAYRKRWGQGTPYYQSWWDVERAKKVLLKLNVALPDLPAFDPATAEEIPFEDEIVALIAELKASRQPPPEE